VSGESCPINIQLPEMKHESGRSVDVYGPGYVTGITVGEYLIVVTVVMLVWAVLAYIALLAAMGI
jgi:hypothetical protein